ncbi:MAG: ABC transporter permease, partial [Acidiferrobacterales bacterium]
MILRRASLHYLLRHPWLIGLSIVGVALGVAVVVAIDVANESARRAFKLSAETLSGKATHEIVGGPQGLAETVYRRLRVDASVRTSAPVVQGYASAPNFPRHTFHVLGIDPLAEDQFRAYVGDVTGDDGTVRLLAEPATALMTDRTARRLGIKVDDILTLSVGGAQHQVTLVGLIESDDALMRQALDLVLVTDIATAQELLGMSGRLSRIDLIIADNDRVLLKRIRAVLPEGATLMRAAGRSNAMDQMTRAFRVNLTALSLLALLVGMFLIYNIMTFSVIQRRSLIGTLRAIGVTRKEVFTHVIIEALAVGTVGTVLGIIVGIVLGNSLVERVVGTINDLYFTLAVSDIAVSWISLLKGIALGIGATTIAALLPAWEATRTPVGTVLRRSEIEAHARVRAPRAALAGAAIALLGAALLWMPTRSLLVSYLALFAIILGFVLLVPMATILLMRALRPLASAFGIAGRMASRGVTAALSRTGVAIAALAVAISATVGVDIMIQSFRHSFIDWLGATLRADIYVAAPVIETSPSAAMLKPELVARFKSIPGVATISTGRRVRLDADAGVKQLFILGTNRKNFASIQFKQSDPANVWEPFQNRDTVLVSEPYAYRHRVAAGDEVRLRTDRGERPFRVIGVYYDYGSDEGRLTLSRKTYDRHW